MKIYVNKLDFDVVRGIDDKGEECYALILDGQVMHVANTEEECVGMATFIERPNIILRRL